VGWDRSTTCDRTGWEEAGRLLWGATQTQTALSPLRDKHSRKRFAAFRLPHAACDSISGIVIFSTWHIHLPLSCLSLLHSPLCCATPPCYGCVRCRAVSRCWAGMAAAFPSPRVLRHAFLPSAAASYCMGGDTGARLEWRCAATDAGREKRYDNAPSQRRGVGGGRS